MKQLLFTLPFCTYSVLVSAQAGFVIYPGTQLVKSGNPSLVLNNMSFINNGTFTPANGTVKITGTSSPTINGTNATSFYDLYAGSSAEVKLEQNITVQHELRMAGMVNVQDRSVTMQTGALILDESETARLQAKAGTTGHATLTTNINAPVVNYHPATLGVEFVNTPPLGITTITRYCTAFAGNGLNATVIQRYYNIQPVINIALNASVRFYYFDAELNGVDESTAVLWKSNDNGVSWLQIIPDSKDVNKNYLQKDHVDDFSLWTIGSPSGALPILLTSFNVSCNEKGAELVWTTAWEQDNDHYVIEKSIDGVQWGEITVISARNRPAGYKFSDTEAGNAFYRLKQVDRDGTFTYSKILRSSCAIASIKLIMFPNPVIDHTELVFQSDRKFTGSVQVYTTSGQLVKRIQVQVQRGQNKIRINMPELKKGTYLLTIDEQEIRLQKKFVKL